MLCAEWLLVSRVREIRMHGLYGGLDFDHRPPGEKE